MNSIADVRVMPPLRCSALTQNPARPFCGELARWMRHFEDPEGERFFCHEHRLPTDTVITGNVIFRRLTLHVDVLLSGVTPLDSLAKGEAFGRLEAAVAELGGLINLHSISSEVCRYGPSLPQDREGRIKGRV